MQKTIITILALTLFSCSQKNHQHQTDNTTLNTGSIVNGEIVMPNEWQSVVSLQTNGQSFCTGNLVNEDTVYSAAHCFVSGPGSEQEVQQYRTALISASKKYLNNGSDVFSLEKSEAIKVLSFFIDLLVKQQAASTTINFGVGKRNGQIKNTKTIAIESVTITDTYKKMFIAGLFPEIIFTDEEKAEIGHRTAKDMAVIKLKETVEDITPIPLISKADMENLSVGQEIILAGFGAKVDPVVIYYVYQTILENREKFDLEIDDQKRDQLKEEINELISFYNEATQLSQSESDKNSVRMKITSINDKTIEVVDNKSGEEAGACHGDSGGPAFIQLVNGEWRQFAVIAQKNPLCHLGNLLMKVTAD